MKYVFKLNKIYMYIYDTVQKKEPTALWELGWPNSHKTDKRFCRDGQPNKSWSVLQYMLDMDFNSVVKITSG